MVNKSFMRVAMYYSNNDVRIEEMPVPKISRGEILVRAEASGICGTDVLEWYRINKVPLVLGHEIAGVIEETGTDVKDYKVGDRISASHHVPCGECYYCKNGHETVCETLRKTNFEPGGFSEYVRLPSINVEKGIYRLPDNVTFEEATFIEPVACVLRGQRIAGMKRGLSVLVVGSGISGLLHIKLAKYNGASFIAATDVVESRLNKAKEFGADAVFYSKEYSPHKLQQLNDGRLVDLVILCTGARTAIEQAINSVERGGTILFFAATDKGLTVPLSINDVFWRNEVTFISSYAATPDEHREALELINTKKINVVDMITHRLPLSETQKGFQLVSEAKESIKVVIEPQK